MWNKSCQFSVTFDTPKLVFLLECCSIFGFVFGVLEENLSITVLHNEKQSSEPSIPSII